MPRSPRDLSPNSRSDTRETSSDAQPKSALPLDLTRQAARKGREPMAPMRLSEDNRKGKESMGPIRLSDDPPRSRGLFELDRRFLPRPSNQDTARKAHEVRGPEARRTAASGSSTGEFEPQFLPPRSDQDTEHDPLLGSGPNVEDKP